MILCLKKKLYHIQNCLFAVFFLCVDFWFLKVFQVVFVCPNFGFLKLMQRDLLLETLRNKIFSACYQLFKNGFFFFFQIVKKIVHIHWTIITIKGKARSLSKFEQGNRLYIIDFLCPPVKNNHVDMLSWVR